MSKELLGLRLILPGVNYKRYQRPWWLGNYSYSNIHCKTLPISALSAIQYGRALEYLIREVFISDPSLGPVQFIKVGVSDSFYCI